MSPTRFPSYEEWFSALSQAQQRRTNDLISLLRSLGAKNAENCARSEISEDIAQLARFAFLRRIWSDHIDSWTREPAQWIAGQIRGAERNPKGHFADAGAALKRMTECGVSAHQIASLARMVACETVFAIVDRIDEGQDPDAPSNCPGWIIVETGADEQMTGRPVGGLHEDLLGLDPSGREGRPE
jgi:hypothetical protein